MSKILEDTGVDCGLIWMESSLTTVQGTAIRGQPLEGISGMFWDNDWPLGLWTELWLVNSVLDHLTTLGDGVVGLAGESRRVPRESSIPLGGAFLIASDQCLYNCHKSLDLGGHYWTGGHGTRGLLDHGVVKVAVFLAWLAFQTWTPVSFSFPPLT